MLQSMVYVYNKRDNVSKNVSKRSDISQLRCVRVFDDYETEFHAFVCTVAHFVIFTHHNARSP